MCAATPLVPVVVSTFGRVNQVALDYFDAIHLAAHAKGHGFLPEPAGPSSLGELISLIAILRVDSLACVAHSQRAPPPS